MRNKNPKGLVISLTSANCGECLDNQESGLISCEFRTMRKLFFISLLGVLIPCFIFVFHGGTGHRLEVSRVTDDEGEGNHRPVLLNMWEEEPDSYRLSHSTNLPLNYGIIQDGAIKIGRDFNVSRAFLQDLQLPPSRFMNLSLDTADKLVFVTAASENHFDEGIVAIARIQHFFPKYKILYYDIGLKPEQAEVVSSWCNVEYHKFDFDKYPPHVRDLIIYSWKPLIVQDVFRHHPDTGLVWMDASFRVHTSDLSVIYKQVVANGGLFTFNHCSHSVYAVTHPQMYQWLPSYMERLKQLNMQGANSIFIYPTEKLYRGFLYWWYLCALDERCQAPPGITRPCALVFEKVADRRNVYYEYCHRFDQSALNLLIGNMYNFDVSQYTVPNAGDFVTIERKKRTEYDIQKCSR